MKNVIGLLPLWIITISSWAHGPVAVGDDRPDRLIEFPDIQHYQTLIVDLHTHSVFSDGHVWPNIRVAEAQLDGLDALAITEHLEYQPHRLDLPHPDRNRAYEIAREAAKDTDLMIIPGVEITRGLPSGHINAVFIKDANTLFHAPDAPIDPAGYRAVVDQWPVQNAVDAAHEQGAFIFWNHPSWTLLAPTGIAEITSFHLDNIAEGKLHGLEVANGGVLYSKEAFTIGLEQGLALLSASDVHNLVDWDYKPHEGVHRPVTLVFSKERSLDGIKEALFARRTVGWFENILFGSEEHLRALLNASVSITRCQYIPGSTVAKLTIANASSASLSLRNASAFSFSRFDDRVTLTAKQSTQFSVKLPTRTDRIELKFEAENALVAPEQGTEIKLVAQGCINR